MVEEAPVEWQEFATRSEGRDPDATVANRDHRRLTNGKPDAAPESEPTFDTLPLIPIAEPGEPTPSDVDFEVTGVLGEGGMGRVLLARQRSLGREVAIKVVRADVGAGATLGALFDEARITGALEHPSVVPVHALGRDAAGRPVLVMKRIDGASWKALASDPTEPRWRDLGDDPIEAHIAVAMAACNALHFAHARGIVHRDVKLDNVMIGSFGEVYVVDWGIAIRAPVPGKKIRTVGTPSYMPPELVVGDLGKTDARTDVYLLGATLHHALVGKPRHAVGNLYAVLQAANASAPFEYDDSLPVELAAILNRATHKDPGARFESALALRRALADFLRHRGSIAISDEATARLRELGPGDAAIRDERATQAILTECRFGFSQAIRAWPENESALAGLQATIEAAVEHEIDRRDCERARALVDELPEPRPALEEKVVALEIALRAEALQAERLLAQARDRDLRVGGRAQLAVLAILPAIFAFTAAYVFTRGRVLTRTEIVAVPFVAFLFIIAAVVLRRRRLTTSISRRALVAVAFVPAAATVHRLVALGFGDEFPSIAASDLVFAAFATLIIGLCVLPRIMWVAVPFAVGAAAIVARPELALPLFAASVASGFALLVVLWRGAVAPE